MDDGRKPGVTEDELDELIVAAGKTHVIPPRENPALLERLRDARVLERARERLRSGDPAWTTTAILCLERIGHVLHDQETAEILLTHASTASDKHEVATALQALRTCKPPEPLDSAPLVALARRQDWQVWQEAVRCLHLAPAEEVEDALLERMSEGRYGVADVAFELRYMRSEKSLEALEYLLGHEALDVRCIALDSLGERLGPGVLPYARRLASGRQHQEKWWAERWLAEYGTAEDVDFMVARAKQVARRGNAPESELSYLATFLRRFPDQQRAVAALAALEAILARTDSPYA